MAYHVKEHMEELIPFLEMSDIPWGIKDTKSINVFYNDSAQNYLNIPTKYDVAGRHDAELPVDWSELADQYQEHDYKVIETQSCVPIIETNNWFGRNCLSPYICDKFPVYCGKEIVGTIWSARPFTLYTPDNYVLNENARFISSVAPVDTFTQTELKVIFFLISHRVTAKEIAAQMGIGKRTVDHHIASIYQKANVSKLKQFVDYARVVGLDCYIPEEYIVKGVKFIQ